jgi:antirestriction protein
MNITFYSLSDYNDGKLIAKTFEISDYATYNEFDEARTEWLDDLTERMNDGELREEYIVADYEDIPDKYVGEWTLDAELWDFLEALDEVNDIDVLKAGVELGIELDKISERYAGHFESDEDLAYDHIESTGMLSEVPDSIKNYFNYVAFGRDLAYDYAEHDGYYFYNC